MRSQLQVAPLSYPAESPFLRHSFPGKDTLTPRPRVEGREFGSSQRSTVFLFQREELWLRQHQFYRFRDNCFAHDDRIEAADQRLLLCQGPSNTTSSLGSGVHETKTERTETQVQAMPHSQLTLTTKALFKIMLVVGNNDTVVAALQSFVHKNGINE